MVVIARFGDARRARRMQDWLLRSHIGARLGDGDDGRLELSVHHRDERRALGVLLAVFWGLDVSHIRPERAVQRALTLENALLGGAIALVSAMLALVAWWVIPVLAIVPIGTIGLIMVVVFLVVAIHPGRTVLGRDPFAPRRRPGRISRARIGHRPGAHAEPR